MPQLRPQAIDGLWQHLCPSFDHYTLGLTPSHCRASQVRLKNSIAYQLINKLPPRRSLVTVIPSHPKKPHFWKRKHLKLRLANHVKDSLSHDAGEERKEQDSRWDGGQQVSPRDENEQSSSFKIDEGRHGLSNDQFHTILQRESERANYEAVQDIIEFLIGERGEPPARAHYQALLAVQANLRHGSAVEVERLLQEMQDSDIEFDAGIYSAVLKALAVHPHYLLRCHIINEMERSWITLTSADYHHIAVGLLKDRQFELAWDQLGIMQTKGFYPEPWLLNLFLYTLSCISAWPEVGVILNTLPSTQQFRLPALLWSHLLHIATREHHQPLVSMIWNRAVKTGYINPSSGLCTTVLESCAVNGDTVTAADVFRLLGQRSSLLQSWHYESLLEAYLVSGDVKGVLSAAQIMAKAGFPLNEDNTRSIFTHLQENPDVISDMLGVITSPSSSTRDSVSLVLINTILEALLAHGNISTALDIFHNLNDYTSKPATVATFNILLQGCAQAVQKETAMSLVRKMRQADIAPTALTYDRLILVCLSTKKQDDLEDAWRYYEEVMAVGKSHRADGGESWGLRRGTIRLLAQNFVGRRDYRAFDSLNRCVADGMDVSGVLRDVEREWQLRWGQTSSSHDLDRAASTSSKPNNSNLEG